MSASINKVIIVGNLGRDPELRFLPDSEPIANIAVATSFRMKDRATGEDKEITEWHRVVFFGRMAEVVGQYLKKGASVYVEGRLQTKKYTDKDGIERFSTDIIAENMQMLGGPSGTRQGDVPASTEAKEPAAPATKSGQSGKRSSGKSKAATTAQ